MIDIDEREFRVSWQRVKTTHPHRKIAKCRSKLFQTEAGARSWYHYLDMSQGSALGASLRYLRFEQRKIGEWIVYRTHEDPRSIGAADA